MNNKVKIGLALGSGSARGWSHIGVIRGLQKKGIEPDIVCGTSAGSIVAAAYASNTLDELENWLLKLEWKDVVGFMDLSIGSAGIMQGKKLFEFFRIHFHDKNIEELKYPFGAVAADLENGHEIWMREGSLLEAVRASISLPGIFSPVLKDGRWLVDGGIVNPIPVSLCRAMGADFVIAVDLNADLLSKNTKTETLVKQAEDKVELPSKAEDKLAWWEGVKLATSKFWGKELKSNEDKVPMPSIVEVISRTINIMQVRITRSRMSGDPPDVLITPHLNHIGMMEFHRGKECIEEGIRALERVDFQVE